jgi:drug/metabolite transporter superfamily protein YnfA
VTTRCESSFGGVFVDVAAVFVDVAEERRRVRSDRSGLSTISPVALDLSSKALASGAAG